MDIAQSKAELVERIVDAVVAGDDPSVGTLLKRFVPVADVDALLYLRERLYERAPSA